MSAEAAPASRPCGASASATTFGFTRPTLTKNESCSATTSHSGADQNSEISQQRRTENQRQPRVAREHCLRRHRVQRRDVEPARRQKGETVESNQPPELLRRQGVALREDGRALRSHRRTSHPCRSRRSACTPRARDRAAAGHSRAPPLTTLSGDAAPRSRRSFSTQCMAIRSAMPSAA